MKWLIVLAATVSVHLAAVTGTFDSTPETAASGGDAPTCTGVGLNTPCGLNIISLSLPTCYISYDSHFALPSTICGGVCTSTAVQPTALYCNFKYCAPVFDVGAKSGCTQP